MNLNLKNYFKENFFDNKGRVKGISINKAKEKFKEFFNNLFKEYPWLSKADQLKQIYYVLFENYTFNDLKCSVKDCDNLKKFHAGKFSLCCKDHKNEAKFFQYQKVSEIVKNRNEEIRKNIVKKSKETFIKKYGVDNPMKNNEIKKKAFENQIKKYGDIVLKAKRNEIIKKWQEKYNTDNPMKSEIVQEKLKKTNKERYGVDFPLQNKEILKKTFRGINYNNQHHMQKDKSYLNNLSKDFIEKNFIDENNYFQLKEFCNYFNYTESHAYNILKKFNINFKFKKGISRAEEELLNFIKDHYQKEIITNSRSIISPYELDIYIPKKNIAIEFNGMLWHSYGKKIFSINEEDYSFQKNRHLLKTKAAEKLNINLLHIFENEWLDPIKQDIWKSVILYKLGLIKNKFYARKLKIKEVNSSVAREFLELNHLQGHTNASVRLGLYTEDNKLISIMTFAKPRFNKNFEYELIRFASLKYNTCVGCAQKLFKYFIEKFKPKSIISYANRRWAFKNKNVYMTLGFQYRGKSEPNYYYFKLTGVNSLKLYSRNNFQKHKLKNIDDIKDFYDDELSESDIMFNAGYRRIYDSGNLVYEWQA